MANASVYRCGIIGLGRMGAGLPHPHTTDPTRKPWTHKMAYETHGKCDVVWGADIIKSAQFGNKRRVDIISVCTPAQYHWQSVNEAIDIGCRAIFCEKPLAPTLHECDGIIKWCKSNNVILAVNHQRAWETYGEITYSGDPLEVGSHAAELYNRLDWLQSIKCNSEVGKDLSINLFRSGPLVSLRSIDDIIACIEGRKEKPACDGWAAREAVRVALESCKYAQAM